MSYKKDHTKNAIKERGEVFTPESLVVEMLNKLPQEYFTSADKTMLDNSCGNGNFLAKILELRMKNNITQIDALKTIYGIELDPVNANECRTRLSLGSKDVEIWKVLQHNIVCANALDANHNGWMLVICGKAKSHNKNSLHFSKIFDNTTVKCSIV
jgi:type I restriction-modification system DNA methylase subunit